MAEEKHHHHHLFHHKKDEEQEEQLAGGGYGESAEYTEATVTEVVSTGENEYDEYKEEKQHKHKQHLGEAGAIAAGAFALVRSPPIRSSLSSIYIHKWTARTNNIYINRTNWMMITDHLVWRGRAQYEKHEAKKDPEHAHRHKIEEEVAAAAAVGSGGFAFHEHHEKKKDHKEAEEAGGEKKHHFFGWSILPYRRPFDTYTYVHGHMYLVSPCAARPPCCCAYVRMYTCMYMRARVMHE
jgi:hypothetical protein